MKRLYLVSVFCFIFITSMMLVLVSNLIDVSFNEILFSLLGVRIIMLMFLLAVFLFAFAFLIGKDDEKNRINHKMDSLTKFISNVKDVFHEIDIDNYCQLEIDDIDNTVNERELSNLIAKIKDCFDCYESSKSIDTRRILEICRLERENEYLREENEELRSFAKVSRGDGVDYLMRSRVNNKYRNMP